MQFQYRSRGLASHRNQTNFRRIYLGFMIYRLKSHQGRTNLEFNFFTFSDIL